MAWVLGGKGGPCRGEGVGEGSPLTAASLLNKLGPFFGDLPVIRPHASGLAIPKTQLSVVNDTLKEAMQWYEKMPDKKLPSLDWIIRAHGYKDRVTHDWEPASGARLHVQSQA